jgi:hypothetical protein
MKEALIKTFEDERKQVERLFKERPYWMGSPYEVVHNALQRCLGVAQFVQTCPNPVPFEEVEMLYTNLKKSLENLLTNP